jgi:DNA modification methylase
MPKKISAPTCGLFHQDALEETKTTLQDKFFFEPFSVFNTRGGWWAERTSLWKRLGIKSELGREGVTTYKVTAEYMKSKSVSDVSIFSPVLCELAYRWFTREKATVLDPFAGGSVRGITAASLGRSYVGIDLSERQIKANKEQAAMVAPDEFDSGALSWVNDDSSRALCKKFGPVGGNKEGLFDFIFSCPPYGDLEKYSDDPDDISNMGYDQFLDTYSLIISRSIRRLKDNRFAVFVVANFRDPNGFMRDFVGDTIRAFEDAGAHFYNEAIIINAVGTGMMRAHRPFNGARKLVKLHQQFLVFCKGDPRKAALWASGAKKPLAAKNNG